MKNYIKVTNDKRLKYKRTNALFEMVDCLPHLHCPVSKLQDHRWIYDNIKELNPDNPLADKVREHLKYLNNYE
jgi:hypothetical protein